MASTSDSKALAKRSLDTSLMPPPPAPKRIKRPAKVLDEDDYTDSLSHIIARDFFPGLLETQSKQEYLDALESQDNEWISAASKNLTEVMTTGQDGRKLRGRRGTSMTPASGLFGRGVDTPKAWQGDTPMSVISTASTTTGARSEKPEIDTNMSLSAFQQKYTSEDNESFYKLLDKQNSKRAEKYAWMWNNNKIPAPRQIAHQKRERLLAANNSAGEVQNGGKYLAVIEPKDSRPAMPDTWKLKPDNAFMFPPSSVEDNLQTVAQKAEETSRAPPKTVVYDNTRIPTTASEDPSSSLVPLSPSLSAVKDAIAGRPRPTVSEASFTGASTPRVNGYAYVDSEPEPPPLLSHESSAALFGDGDSTPNPFKLKESSKREALHHRMVDKVAKGKRALGKKEAELKTPVPRFASSPRVTKGGMTPAAQRLMGKVRGVGGTPSRLWDGRTKTPRRSGLREGWTPKEVAKGKA